ncbi:MAG: hypothetical protein ACJA08_001493 [Cyclobacteriaceae bacterium]|jgi:hypothetical protein
MQGYHLFEYATIRLIPKVERGEFVNIGSILYCSGERFLQCVFHWDEARMLALFPDVDIVLVKDYTRSFELICEGSKAGGGIAEFAIAERFRWLTATRSTIIQGSPVHTGYTKDARATLEKLHADLVKMA